jgi:hypothetical protein
VLEWQMVWCIEVSMAYGGKCCVEVDVSSFEQEE